jgi:hypothetical protein
VVDASAEARVTGMAGPHKKDTMTKLVDTLRENTVGVAARGWTAIRVLCLK